MEHHSLLLHLILILVFARIAGEIAIHLKMPSVIGEIATGIILGPSLLKLITPDETITFLAEVGIIGLTVIVLTTAFNGITDEHALGHAFEEALPFTSLLVVFFAVVAVIDQQGLFKGVIDTVLSLDKDVQVPMFYLANGLLSAISDNVFVGTVYITELKQALANSVIDRQQYDLLAVAINTGTNIPSVATPNGQAAFLFLLTSSLAPLIRLGYLTMVYKALPYTIIMTIVGLLAVNYILPDATVYMTEAGIISHYADYDPTAAAPAADHH